MKKSTENKITFSFGPLALIFLVLKLAYVIDWPWIWVLSPVWIPMALWFLIIGLAVIAGVLKR